ncbi:hypothetical protein PPACK8108_LOCUS11900 [Phakopsora pachyrhizi]|uniref:Uncharacterized protein n=1 Tax=Phakopsora pachyrhizi TaxID=170000 RepID=A0AAV0B1D6_PHAPC|nr:hypothetical protein PPACK8108_LOCUS11900 [Phakopsora pachyrhizi]
MKLELSGQGGRQAIGSLGQGREVGARSAGQAGQGGRWAEVAGQAGQGGRWAFSWAGGAGREVGGPLAGQAGQGGRWAFGWAGGAGREVGVPLAGQAGQGGLAFGPLGQGREGFIEVSID